MTYDTWKCTAPRDYEPEEELDESFPEPDYDPAEHKLLACGCRGQCDPFAHDTAPDWDGKPDGPDWSDLSLEERDQWVRDHPYCHDCGDDLSPEDIEMGHRYCQECAEKPASQEPF